MTVYTGFLLTKGVLNLGAGVAAVMMKNPAMGGFWVLLGLADIWIALWSDV